MESQSKFENGTNPPSYEEVSKSTATIVHEGGIGSGFFIEKNLLVTNHHVVESAKDGDVFFRTWEGIKDIGKVVVADEESDLAIIQTLRSDYTALEMSSDREKIGDEIFVIGSPEGLGGTLSKGIISAQRRGDLLQITAPISSGSSGSPVFSKGFKVIGIVVSSMSEGQNLNFAISVDKLQNLIQQNKVALERAVPEEVTRHSDSNFDKELASYENKEDKTLQEMFDMASTYYSEENYQKAFYWFGEAAGQGYAKAQHNLALMYNKGEGIAKDHRQAVYWHKKSAGQGYAKAQYDLALMYADGRGIVQNHQKALYWYRKAANQGHAKAQYNLAFMYYNGEGVIKNYVEAYKWVILSKAQRNEDNENINKILDLLKSEMTPSQIAKAQKLANQFQAQSKLSKLLNWWKGLFKN